MLSSAKMASEFVFNVHFQYYGVQRITPVYVSEQEFMNMTYDDFVNLVSRDVEYLRRMTSPRLMVEDEDGQLIDIPQNNRFRQLICENLKCRGGNLKGKVFVQDGTSPSVSGKHATTDVESGGVKKRRLQYDDEFLVPKIKPSEGPTMETRKDEIMEKLDNLMSSRLSLEQELRDLKSVPPPLSVLALPGLRVLETATCKNCHHRGHRESGNKNKAECCYETCPGYMYCGKLERHKDHAENIKQVSIFIR